MSRTELHVGKVKEVNYGLTSLEETAKMILWELGEDVDNIHNSIEYLLDEHYDKYVRVKDKLYKIIVDKEYQEDDLMQATKNSDGTIDYVVQFYNGGCGFNEALEEAINNLD